MAKKTKADALKTRQHLIETAIAQFALRGVANTTLNDIADAADVTRAPSTGTLRIKRSCLMRFGYSNHLYANLFRIGLRDAGMIILYRIYERNLLQPYNILRQCLVSRH